MHLANRLGSARTESIPRYDISCAGRSEPRHPATLTAPEQIFAACITMLEG
jgi:hypothetical protein